MNKLVSLLGFGAAFTFSSNALAQEDAQLAPPSCDYGTPHPNAPKELAQFDFLIGDYTITPYKWVDGEWLTSAEVPPARWNGRFILGGMAIEDEWYDIDPGLNPEVGRGVNVRMWDAEDGEWDMMWVHSRSRQVQDLRAKVIDETLTMWQLTPERPGFRAIFERVGPDSWYRIAYQTNEAGEEEPTYKLLATRIPCAEG